MGWLSLHDFPLVGCHIQQMGPTKSANQQPMYPRVLEVLNLESRFLEVLRVEESLVSKSLRFLRVSILGKFLLFTVL